jgi:hypothetical protein
MKKNGFKLKEIQAELRKEGIKRDVSTLSVHFKNHPKGQVPDEATEKDVSKKYVRDRLSDAKYIVDQIAQNLEVLREITEKIVEQGSTDSKFINTVISACREIRLTFGDLVSFRESLNIDKGGEQLETETILAIIKNIPAEWTGHILEELEKVVDNG